MSAQQHESGRIELARRQVLSAIPWLNDFLYRISPLRRLNQLIEAAGSTRPLGFYVLLSGLLAATVIMGGAFQSVGRHLVVPFALTAAVLPFYVLVIMKRKRIAKFERQLPDALDLVARSLKAGHAFSSGMKMASDEFDDPLGTEFGKTLDEINFGVGVPDALKNLAERIDCPDLNFFVISVLIQRETGGNLAEIIENIGQLIRERFKLQGMVRALSAEGRLSAIILVILPVLVSFYLYVVQPDYIMLLVTDPLGRAMASVIMLLMVCGVYMMRRMVRFRF